MMGGNRSTFCFNRNWLIFKFHQTCIQKFIETVNAKLKWFNSKANIVYSKFPNLTSFFTLSCLATYKDDITFLSLYVFYGIQENDELILETFYHQDGSTYTCAYQGGQRFILDMATQVGISQT